MWLALLFQARVGQQKMPESIAKNPFGYIPYMLVRLYGLIGLPVCWAGTLLTLRDSIAPGWFEPTFWPILTMSVGQIVVPEMWSLIANDIPTKYRSKIRDWALAALFAAILFAFMTSVWDPTTFRQPPPPALPEPTTPAPSPAQSPAPMPAPADSAPGR